MIETPTLALQVLCSATELHGQRTPPPRLELGASRLTVARSSQLSYRGLRIGNRQYPKKMMVRVRMRVPFRELKLAAILSVFTMTYNTLLLKITGLSSADCSPFHLVAIISFVTGFLSYFSMISIRVDKWV